MAEIEMEIISDTEDKKIKMEGLTASVTYGFMVKNFKGEIKNGKSQIVFMPKSCK